MSLPRAVRICLRSPAVVFLLLGTPCAWAELPPEPTVGELVEKYDKGSTASQEVVREILLDAEAGIFWMGVISARETKTKPIYCRPLDKSLDGEKLIDVLRRGAKSPDFAGAPYAAGLALALKHLYPCD